MQKIWENTHFSILTEKNSVYMNVRTVGFLLKDFDSVLQAIPRVSITKFVNLRNALQEARYEPVEIGVLKPRVEVILSADFMQAKIRLHISETELVENMPIFIAEITDALEKVKVNSGVHTEVIHFHLKPGEEIIVAEGVFPVKGEDAQVSYFQLSERKPVIQQNGRVDYFEMNFFDEVKKGDWLGEKILATNGIPGLTITGTVLPAMKGEDKTLRYDKDTIGEFPKEGKIELLALKDGAVSYLNGKIYIQEILIIEGDVGAKTGNIEYDGSITIKGTINDGFSVIATKDITVLGDIGIGAVDKIVSRNGDIYIKGGVFGKERAYIEAGQNVYVKHANECTIRAEGDIHIGLYAIGCKLSANNIFLDRNRGRIIGGDVQAKTKVVTAYIGNAAERMTNINVEGFDRTSFIKELEDLVVTSRKLLTLIEKKQNEMKVFDAVAQFKGVVQDKEKEAYSQLQKEHEQMLQTMYAQEDRRNNLLTMLKTKGEGEVAVLRKAFPKTFLQIKEMQRNIDKITAGVFFVKEKTMFFE